ncbi:MAG: hypothetical protein WC393_01925 [Candidatus Nanoarchaeia archaeon]|jgi:hypothetical protein
METNYQHIGLDFKYIEKNKNDKIIDLEMMPFLRVLNYCYKIKTFASCSGHNHKPSYVIVLLPDKNVSVFEQALKPYGLAKVKSIGFEINEEGIGTDKPDFMGYEYITKDLMICIKDKKMYSNNASLKKLTQVYVRSRMQNISLDYELELAKLSEDYFDKYIKLEGNMQRLLRTREYFLLEHKRNSEEFMEMKRNIKILSLDDFCENTLKIIEDYVRLIKMK